MSRNGDLPNIRFLANARALALGGRIDTIRLNGEQEIPVGASFAIEGGSCSLGSEGGRSTSRAKGRSTIVAGQRIVRFDAAEAEAWEEYRDEKRLNCRTFTRATIRGLEVGGLPGMPRLRLEYGEMVVRSDHELKGEDEVQVTFTVEVMRLVNLILGGEHIQLAESPREERKQIRQWTIPGRGKASAEAAPKKGLERTLLMKEQKHGRGNRCEGKEPGWYYYDDFGFVRFGVFDVTDDTYVATLLEFRLGCAVTGGGVVIQASGNGTIDPHPR